ncbi:hypothetical protein GGS24DRAFT_443418 [Hypoxylon argillaceum]|nr:hypothetical protein GGS24DRAFT_443418 [Hypoxylon argillaceum]
MAETASTRLVSHAATFSKAIFSAFDLKRLKPSDLACYRIAGEVAVTLHLISTYLDSLPPYWIELEVEQLCSKILQDLENITRPGKRPLSRSTPFNRNKPAGPATDLASFFKIQTEDAQNFKITCNRLLSELTKGDNVAMELPDSALQLNIPDVSDDFNSSVFEALQLTTLCEPAKHGTNNEAPANQKDPSQLRHPTRLCLHEPETQELASRNIAILVSAMDMTFWQEFYLRIRPEGTVNNEQQALNRGGFCTSLETDITARRFLDFKHDHGLFLLRESGVLTLILQAGPGVSLRSIFSHYKLTSKDKVILSYAIAQSYWKYYNSELMQIKWTSDTIWFMFEEDTNGQKDQLPLRAYISLPFGLNSSTTADVIYEDLMNHQCPRIFDLGVLLLEIGLGKPFQTPKRRDVVSQANLNHKRALDELLELEQDHWDGFANKKYFDSAVKFCLSCENFNRSKHLKKTRQGVIVSTPTWDGQAGILKRRRMLHKNVVRPLEWLAKRGFKAQSGNFTYISKKHSHSRASNTSLPPEPEALFHSNIIPNMWLTNLKKISEQVERKRRECRVTAPVRVAILDTGFDRNFSGFTVKSGLVKNITDEADFIGCSTRSMIDTFGHGTFMARLVMECAPNVEILVARVAENTNTLHRSRENIKKAILWAGQTGNADIISMSFGFPDDDKGIRDAIETVYKNRGEDVIFFASAGNSSTDDESFPARHPHVISVYATNCYGTFLRSNSASTTNGAAVLGTYGDDIPDFIREEFSTTYPKVCQPGSSAATAIMAGIGATMLLYASVLPLLVPLQGMVASTSNRVLKHLRTAKGMEAMLNRLAQRDFDHPRLKAVNPIWFWKDKPSDIQRYFAIIDALSDVDRRSPRMATTS